MSVLKKSAAGLAMALGMATFPSLGNAAVYDFFQNACASGLGCSGSGLIATVTTSTVGSNTQLVFHIVDSNFSFLQAGQPPQNVFDASGTPVLVSDSGGPTAQTNVWTLDSGGVVIGNNFPNGLGFTPTSNDTFSADMTFVLSGVTGFNSLNGFFFGVDLCQGTTSTDSCTSGKTGFAEAVLSTVPLPPAVALFGSALVGLGLLGRRRRKPSGAQA
jgi:hypothetical protein